MGTTVFIPQIPTSTDPVLPRARLLHNIIERVNANTLRVLQPQQVNQPENAEAARAAASREAGTVVEGETPGDDGATTGVVEEVEPTQTGLGKTITRYELRKQVSTVKVEDPDDPETFVTVARRVKSFYLLSDGTTQIDEYFITDD